MARQPGDAVPGLVPLYGNLYFQYGTSTFTDNASDTTIRTNLESIKAGFATYANESLVQAATDGEAVLAVSSDISSGTIGISRQGATAALADMTDVGFSYFIIGTIDLTD